MLNFVRRRALHPVRLLTAAILLVSAGTAAHADFSIAGTYLPVTGGYFYNLNITNNGPEDLLLVSLFQTGVLTMVDQTTAPADFQVTTSSDGVTSFVDFSPAVGSPALFGAGVPVGPFQFRSDALFAPNAEVFGLDINGNNPTGTVSIVVVPEPGATAFAIVSLLAVSGLAISRRIATITR